MNLRADLDVLVVEDEDEISALIRSVLSDDGHHCVIARNTREADLVIETTPVEAMVLDLGPPGSGALAWLGGIAALVPGLATRTIVATGRAPGEALERRVAAAGAHLLYKPYAFDELRQRVRRFGADLAEERRGRDADEDDTKIAPTLPS